MRRNRGTPGYAAGMPWTTWTASDAAWWADADPTTRAEALLALPVSRELAASRSTRCEAVTAPDGRACVRKTWTWPRVRDRWKGAFRTTVGARSPAERERRALERLRALPVGPCAPAPLATAEERDLGVLRRCVLLLERIDGATDLATFLRDATDAGLRAAVLDDLARRVAAMHAAGLLDRDLHPRNVLVEPTAARTWLIDSPKQRTHPGPLPLARAALDLAAVDVGLVALARGDERDRFFARYVRASACPDTAELHTRVAHWRSILEPRERRRLPPAAPPTRFPPGDVS